MDINVLKHLIYYEDTVFNESAEQGIEIEISLPDYCEGIKRVLKCKTQPTVTSKGINDHNLFVDGNIRLCILYVDENNCLRSYEHFLPVSKSFELNECYDNSYITASIKCDFLNCRAISDKKIDIRGTASIKVITTVRKQTEVLSDVEGCNIETLKDSCRSNTPMGFGEKNLIIEEELSIGNGQASVENILKYDIIPIIEEFKVINNKVITKGNLKIYVLYSSHESTRPNNYYVVVPFSQIVDIEGVNEDCKCECGAQVVFSELKLRNNDDECRSFVLTAKLIISVNAYCDSEIPIIYDAYSTVYNTSLEKSELSIKSLKENFSDNFIAKKTIEFSDGAIGSVIDMWCDCHTTGYKIDGKYIILYGSVIVQIFSYDVEGLPNYFERPIDFEYRFEITKDYYSLDCKILADITNSSFTILSANKIEITMELGMVAHLYDTNYMMVVTNIDVMDSKKEKYDNDCGIIVYFAEKGERIWDIAKKYNSCINEIIDLNGCKNDALLENKSLIIPIK